MEEIGGIGKMAREGEKMGEVGGVGGRGAEEGTRHEKERRRKKAEGGPVGGGRRSGKGRGRTGGG